MFFSVFSNFIFYKKKIDGKTFFFLSSPSSTVTMRTKKNGTKYQHAQLYSITLCCSNTLSIWIVIQHHENGEQTTSVSFVQTFCTKTILLFGLCAMCVCLSYVWMSEKTNNKSINIWKHITFVLDSQLLLFFYHFQLMIIISILIFHFVLSQVWIDGVISQILCEWKVERYEKQIWSSPNECVSG